MIKCPECNSLVDDNLKECDKCGYPFKGTEEYIELAGDDEKKDEQVGTINSDEVIKNEERTEENEEIIESPEMKNKPKEEDIVCESAEIEIPAEEQKDEGYILNSDINEPKKEKKKLKLNKRDIFEIVGGIVLVILLVYVFNLVSAD